MKRPQLKVPPKRKRSAPSAKAAVDKSSRNEIARRLSPARKRKRRSSSSARKPPKGPDDSFPIVGIGASAGGLEAFTQLLKHLPADTGMSFVLVQHLDPQHESALAQLLGRAATSRCAR